MDRSFVVPPVDKVFHVSFSDKTTIVPSVDKVFRVPPRQ